MALTQAGHCGALHIANDEAVNLRSQHNFAWLFSLNSPYVSPLIANFSCNNGFTASSRFFTSCRVLTEEEPALPIEKFEGDDSSRHYNLQYAMDLALEYAVRWQGK
jgi:hypothetical protein